MSTIPGPSEPTLEQLVDYAQMKKWEADRPDPGAYTLPGSSQRVIVWYDKNNRIHVNGMGVSE